MFVIKAEIIRNYLLLKLHKGYKYMGKELIVVTKLEFLMGKW